jgi:glutathione synthase/RimK-type ligase-like ATP-grasp enzyme
MKQQWLGIMHCKTNGHPPFGESSFFKELSLIGRREGVPVFVFCPKEVNLTSNTLIGYRYQPEKRKWERNQFPLPSLVYDRCFYVNPGHFQSYQPYVKRLKQSNIPFMGYGLQGKWEVYEILEKYEQLRPYIPKSRIIYQLSDIWPELQRHPIIFKPKAGSQGKNIYRLEKIHHEVDINGRNNENRAIKTKLPASRLDDWLKTVLTPRRFLIQPYLELTTKAGRSYDVRSLVQKNAEGRWTVTGMAVRCGKKDSLTSNLHGGGDVYPITSFLQREFGDDAQSIIDTLQKLSIEICTCLEDHHGRLIEVGVDFGIDRNQNIWVLEANSKPGRSVFRIIQDKASSRASVEKLIHYARTLLSNK